MYVIHIKNLVKRPQNFCLKKNNDILSGLENWSDRVFPYGHLIVKISKDLRVDYLFLYVCKDTQWNIIFLIRSSAF